MIENNSEILQVHYYLNEGSHSMNAVILNKAENEILKLIHEISNVLDLEIITESQALEEGGIKAVYKFFGKKKTKRKIGILSAFLVGITSTIISEVVSDNIKTDYEFEQLKKQELTLRIEKLKKDLEEDNGEITEGNIKIIQDLSIYISETNKIKLTKSEFYSTLLKEEKIKKVSTQRLNQEYEPVAEEKVVPRRDFQKFIVETTEIEDDYQEQIELEIISPVLKRNNIKWKAVYNEEDISFTLKDKHFKELVITKSLSFSNGTKIVCDLETRQKMNTDGEIINGPRSVYSVSSILYTDGTKVDIIKD